MQADCCVDRGGIFPYLEANGIGLEHGLFYEAYAMLLEASRDYSKADYVFQVGISRYERFLQQNVSLSRFSSFLYLAVCQLCFS
jgi:hypothetical protein